MIAHSAKESLTVNLFFVQIVRYMKVLKGYVRNRARPEGCIAEWVLTEECVRLCSGYIQQVEAVGTKYHRNQDFEDEAIIVGRPLLKGSLIELSAEMQKIVHLHVLLNSAEVEPYIK